MQQVPGILRGQTAETQDSAASPPERQEFYLPHQSLFKNNIRDRDRETYYAPSVKKVAELQVCLTNSCITHATFTSCVFRARDYALCTFLPLCAPPLMTALFCLPTGVATICPAWAIQRGGTRKNSGPTSSNPHKHAI